MHGRHNTKQAKVPYFHCGPLKNEKRKRKVSGLQKIHQIEFKRKSIIESGMIDGNSNDINSN